ncbi:putative phage tail protein [Clostridium sp. AWRP]|uniref:putative phage tail protein n=1 Tax=Clostridium sp. AWRP TaxID=2212991 RepID=UPI000FD6F7A6|nr:putative phage tail protein [Clostridium sp. AWRP]AZV57915.1 DUF2313 domain-containing protein [Clostridium sp. AWRP]
MDLKSYLPPFIFDSKVLTNLFDGYEIELDTLNNNLQDLLNQLFPQTASWGLKFWEEFLGIPVNESLDIIIRRSKILSQMAMISPMTFNRFCSIISKFADKTEVEQHFSDYSFDVTLITKHNFNINLQDIAKTIETIKPAHLGYSFNLETQKDINIAVKREFAFNPLNMCGDFYCGDGIVVSSCGRSYLSSIAAHADYSKNIKNYDLTGTIVSSINPDNENGIATIGRAYSVNENIKAAENHLYDTQLSKNDVSASVVGSINNLSLQIQTKKSNTIKNYTQAGTILSSENVDGEEGETIIAKTYDSTIRENLNKTDSIKKYNQAGDILASEEEYL